MALLLALRALDTSLRRTSFDGYCPAGARWIAAAENAGAVWAGLEASDVWRTLGKKGVYPLTEVQLSLRKRTGIRPTPTRWSVYLGDRLLAAQADSGAGICVYPGLILRVVQKAQLLLSAPTSDGIRAYGDYFYAWRDGFLIVSTSRAYVAASLQAPMSKLEPSHARNELRVFIPGARASVVRIRGENGLPVEGRIPLHISGRQTPLTLTGAWPSPPLCAVTASRWSDISRVLSLFDGVCRDAPIRRAGEAFAEELLGRWALGRLAGDWDAETDQCSLGLLGMQGEENWPVPQVALIERTMGPQQLKVHPLAGLATESMPALPYEWGGQPGRVYPLLGEQWTLCLGRGAHEWIATNQEPVMAGLAGRATEGEALAADLTIRLNWRACGEAAEQVLNKIGGLELVPRMNAADLEARVGPVVKGLAECGELEIDAQREGAFTAFHGYLAWQGVSKGEAP